MPVARTLAMAAMIGAGVGIAQPAAAQTVTAFRTGETTTGLTRQCFYEALGNAYTQTVGSATPCPHTLRVQLPPGPAAASEPSPPATPRTVTGFRTGEETTGLTKQCFYDALGNAYTRTVAAVDLCPLTVRVRIPGALR